MEEIRIRSKELVKRMKEEAEARGVPMEGLLWGWLSGTETGRIRDRSGTKVGQKRDSWFVEPTDEELSAEYRTKKYHFNLEKFKAYYRTRGWKPKGSNVPMKDWRSAMVTSEEYWKEENGVNGTGGSSQEEPVRKVVKCKRCGDQGLIQGEGLRLVPCPECRPEKYGVQEGVQ